MRHLVKKGSKLNRKPDHRALLIRNLATSLVDAGRIETSQARAAAVVPYLERLIAQVKSAPNDREAVKATAELFTESSRTKVLKELKTRYATRAGGFTRQAFIGVQKGDASPKVILELV